MGTKMNVENEIENLKQQVSNLEKKLSELGQLVEKVRSVTKTGIGQWVL